MSYDSIFDAAENDNLVDEVSCAIHKWETPGDQLTGRLLGFENFDGGNFGQCIKYLLDTDEGKVSFILGTAADKYMENVTTGSIIRITYQGTKDISDGKRVNMFNVKFIKEVAKPKK